ncbi:hypothetical protein [Streptomyces sp. NPDC002088]|uniref:hypothetical protein n=1 Tax=Streptomyces sp. NPDC002088 TaxID=3154665 RepID=UPI003327315B
MPVPYIRQATWNDEETLGGLDRATWSYLHAVTPPPGRPHEPFFTERAGPVTLAKLPLVAPSGATK